MCVLRRRELYNYYLYTYKVYSMGILANSTEEAKLNFIEYLTSEMKLRENEIDITQIKEIQKRNFQER